MLIAGSALKGYAIEADDGRIGAVATLLFDDMTWKIRWLVIDIGTWLPGRQVLIHPSAIGKPEHERQYLPVYLTKAQIKDSPDIRGDEPVSRQIETNLYDYYGWQRDWGTDFHGAGMTTEGQTGGYGMPYPGGERAMEADTMQRGRDEGDPHLRSMTAVHGYRMHATDGTIGHVANFLLDDTDWAIRYLVVDTSDWWFGSHVLISPFAVTSIDWTDRAIHLSVDRAQVKASPPWEPMKFLDQTQERRLHQHYAWPGYGW